MTFWVFVDFSARLPKLIDVGVTTRSANAFSPLPARDTETGADEASEVIVTVAEALPELVGAKAKVYLRLLAGRMVRGTEGPEMENSLLETESAEINSGAVPVLEIVRVCVSVWPTTTVLNLTELVERVSVGCAGGCLGPMLAHPTANRAIRIRPAAQSKLRADVEIGRDASTRRKTPCELSISQNIRLRTMLATCPADSNGTGGYLSVTVPMNSESRRSQLGGKPGGNAMACYCNLRRGSDLGNEMASQAECSFFRLARPHRP